MSSHVMCHNTCLGRAWGWSLAVWWCGAVALVRCVMSCVSVVSVCLLGWAPSGSTPLESAHHISYPTNRPPRSTKEIYRYVVRYVNYRHIEGAIHGED